MGIGTRAKEQKGRRACGPRPHRCAENSSRSDCRTQQIRLEKLGDEVRDGHGAPANQPHHFFFSEAADFAANLQQLPNIFFRGLIDLRRGQREQLRDYFRRARQSFFQLQIIRSISLGKFLDFSRGGVGIGTQNQRAPILRRREHSHAGLHHLQAVFRELHIARDSRKQRPSRVRHGGAAKTRMKFFSHTRAADNFPALQHQRF